MPSGRFSKQADWFATQKLNNNYTDSVIGGLLTTAPAGLQASQGTQTYPGDRIILSPSDALFWSNNTVGNLYTGTFRYVSMNNNTFSDPTRAHAAFWDISPVVAANNNGANSTADGLYQVTSDEAANIGVSLFAGVFINNVATVAGNNYYWWIQESGKASAKFRTTITGTAAIGSGVYLAAGGNNNNAADVGAFDQLVAGNSAAIFTANSTTGYSTVDQMIVRYVGPAESLPSNNNISLVDFTLSRASFRW